MGRKAIWREPEDDALCERREVPGGAPSLPPGETFRAPNHEEKVRVWGVERSCGSKLGIWYCVAHLTPFRTQGEATRHGTRACTWVWLCKGKGCDGQPEAPSSKPVTRPTTQPATQPIKGG